ncbi:TIGR03905 family TSCPD domain-containing protein [uncultured Bacteroides sp.]|uniref:TIGR03905 family TSCPD domain-containing protein n=1 Tax=uncultured Bacteroides sp. TaxID=162156 RepID=UPI002AAAF98A|nr:TIGR03905 family TSCPD domain-containing protein [uncultured Bacteroides sp.]
MKSVYKTSGTCSTYIVVDVEDGILKDVSFQGGCNGNLKGICELIKGMPVDEVISKLEGISCGGRPTSCPDQLCQALRQVKTT